MSYDMDQEPGHHELLAQITHPIDEYAPGSERLERLYEAMALSTRYRDQGDVGVNV